MAAALTADDAPIGEVNTTPLIDVMLVLLVMFIITIPIQSNAVKVDLPTPADVEVPIEVSNKLVVTADGRLLWNARAISLGELSRVLARVASMPDQPELQFQPDADARYELVDEVLAVAKRANVTALGFVGNERYGRF